MVRSQPISVRLDREFSGIRVHWRTTCTGNEPLLDACRRILRVRASARVLLDVRDAQATAVERESWLYECWLPMAAALAVSRIALLIDDADRVADTLALIHRWLGGERDLNLAVFQDEAAAVAWLILDRAATHRCPTNPLNVWRKLLHAC